MASWRRQDGGKKQQKIQSPQSCSSYPETGGLGVDCLCNGDLSTTTLGWPVAIYNRLPMTAFLLAPLLLIAYGALCLLAPEKHLAFNAWLNRRSRMKWHEHRAYTAPGLRMERRWSQLTPANLRRIRVTGIAFACMGLWIIWEYWRVHR